MIGSESSIKSCTEVVIFFEVSALSKDHSTFLPIIILNIKYEYSMSTTKVPIEIIPPIIVLNSLEYD